MADNVGSPKTPNGQSETAQISEEGAIPGFQNVNLFSQQTLRTLMMATKTSNDLPSSGDDYDYYSSFESFRSLMDMESTRILELIQAVMRYHGAKGNLATSSTVTEIEEKFDVLTDANDQLLERVGTFLDEAAGLKKREAPLVIASVTPKAQVSGSWNKKALPTRSDKAATFRLLAARRVERPQLKFKDKVDNSSRPFVPKIKCKPNAIKSLSESLQIEQSENAVKTIEEDDEERLSFPHPYQYELDHFTPLPEQLEKPKEKKPLELEETPYKYVDTESDLQLLCDTLKKQKEFSVDVEHHSYRTYLGITCLIQISTWTQDFLVDALALRSELHILNEVFTDPKIVKVFHGADMDVEWLQRDLGLYVVNMFDTGQAARVLNLGRYSLANLLWQYCQVQADKQYQLADWRMRPLPKELIRYAQEDTHYLLHIHNCMKTELLEKGNKQKNLLMATLDRSKQICAKIYKKPLMTDDSRLEFYKRSRKVFNSQQIDALKNLCQWRDKMARQNDESTGYVLPNHMLLQIAELLPREAPGIVACCNPVPPLLKQNLVEIHRMLMDAREVPLTKAEPTRTTEAPQVQHPKYNVDSLLNSAHDCSHDHNHSSTVSSREPDPSLVASSSSLFKDSSIQVSPVKLLDIAHLSIFTCSSQAKMTKEAIAARRKAARIKGSFNNPFEKYLPCTDPARKPVLAPPELVDDQDLGPVSRLQPATIQWKLLPHTVKRKPVLEEANPVVMVNQPQCNHIRFADEDEDDEDDQTTPVRQQGKRESNFNKHQSEERTHDRSASGGRTAKPCLLCNKTFNTTALYEAHLQSEGHKLQSHIPVSSEVSTHSKRKNKRKSPEMMPIPQYQSTPGASGEKKHRLNIEDLEQQNFQAHSYSTADMMTFKGEDNPAKQKKKKRKNKEFDPESMFTHEFRPPSKPRLKPTSGKKSMSGNNRP